MKKVHIFVLFFGLAWFTNSMWAQEKKISPEAIEILQQVKELEMENWRQLMLRGDKRTRTHEDFDALYYELNLKVSLNPNNLEAAVTGCFQSKIEGLQTVVLDFDDALTIDAVTGSVSEYILEGEEFEITLDLPYNTGEIFEITTTYHGLPRLLNDIKAFNFRHHGGVPTVATLSTPFLAHTWWPCKDGPEDKPDSVDINITIPDESYGGYDLYASSNGRLVDIVDNGDGTRTFKWHEGYPIPVYYVGIAISNYRIFSHYFQYSDTDSMEVPYYIFPESYSDAQQTFEDVVDMIGFLSERFCQYPFITEKYAMSEIGFYGAIENQTNTIMGGVNPNWYMIVIHELAHQWFGDMITCANWHHGWVNEGFASYCEALWIEHIEGFESYKDYMARMDYYDGGTVYLKDVSDPFQVFVGIIYGKGAWVLHMLRHVVGEDNFWIIMGNYCHTYAYGYASTEDFQSVCENVYGQSLNWFFQQWIYEEYYPVYAYHWSSVEQDGNHTVMLTIEQVQVDTDVFKMPIDVTFLTQEGTETIVVFDSLQTQTFKPTLSSKPIVTVLDRDGWILKKSLIPGDVTGEGNVDVVDIIFAVNFILKTMEPTEVQFQAADCNGDRTLNVLDLVCMVNIIRLVGP